MHLRSALAPCLGLLVLTACVPVALSVANVALPKTLYFHPVQGPIFDQHPGTALTGSATGQYRSGHLSLTLPSGEVCQGDWALVPQTQTETGLAGSWDQIYGSGFFVQQIQGSRSRAKAALRGDRGTEVQVEFHRSSEQGSPLQGVAKDAAGNLFKITR